MTRMLSVITSLLVIWGSLISVSVLADSDYQKQRDALITQIKHDFKTNRDFLDQAEFNQQVLQAIATVPREQFVPEKQRRYAYKNRPLPIGYGQTISQPTMVAMMTDLLRIKPGDKVLEIGTGSGYQAAILAQLGAKVFSIEIIPQLAKQAAKDLHQAGYDQVQLRTGDGYYGWPEAAPFDAIIVTAAASHIPPALIKQLKQDGRMVIPVGDRFMIQHLLVVTKDKRGNVLTQQTVPVQFVPLTGAH